MNIDSNARYLIFGALGQDGSYLTEKLSLNGFQVTGVTRSSSTIPENKFQDNVAYSQGNILDEHFIEKLLFTKRPTHIFNLASASSVAESFLHPEISFHINLLFVQQLIKSLEKYRDVSGVDPVLIQASSSEMYGPHHFTPITEFSIHDPQSPYAQHKSEAHMYCIKARKENNLKISTAILFNHESPRRPIRFVSRKITRGAFLISKGLQDKLILGNIEVERDWGFAPDYVEAIWKIGQSQKNSDYVVASGELNSISHMCEVAFEELGLGDFRKYVESDPRFYRSVENSGLVGDPSKIKLELNWEKKTSFEEMTRYMVNQEKL